MNGFHFFAGLWTQMEVPVQNAVNGCVTALSGYVTGPFRAWVLVYLLGTLTIAAYQPSDDAFMRFFRHLFRAAFVYMIVANAAQFNTYFGNMALNILPQGISNAIAGAAGGNAVNGDAFDALWVKGYQAGVIVLKAVPWYSLKSIPIGIAVIAYWFVAMVAVLAMFAVYLISHILVALLVASGVLFVALRMWPETYRYFYGWLSALLGAIIVQIFAVLLLTILVRAEGTQLTLIANGGANAVNGANLFEQLLILLDAAMLFLASAMIAQQLFGVGQAIAGGVYVNAEPISRGIMAGLGAGAAVAGEVGTFAVTEMNPDSTGYSFMKTVGSAP